MQPQLKGAPLTQTARQFIAAIKATKFADTIDLQNLLDTLPAVHLRPGYSLGWYREGEWMGTHVHLYPFRTGSKDEYDPGIHNRDIEHKSFLDIIHLFERAKKGDAEAAQIIEQREHPTPFRDGQFIRCSIMMGADDSVPKLKDYLDIDFTPESVWQSLLLLELSSNYLPHGWHGGYANGTIILEPDDLKKEIRYCRLERSQWEPFLTDDRLIPSVTMLSDAEALITFCRWGDWSGLGYMTYHAFRDGRTIRFDRQDPVNLIKYDCGIRF